MPVLNGPTAVADGAFAAVQLAPIRADRAQMRRTGQPIARLDVSALIDTGAEMTCIDKTVANRLGLPPSKFGTASAPALSGLGYTAFYKIELTVPHPTTLPSQFLVIPDLEVLELDLSTHGYDAVLGRDVLAYCLLVYDGLTGTFTLSY